MVNTALTLVPLTKKFVCIFTVYRTKLSFNFSNSIIKIRKRILNCRNITKMRSLINMKYLLLIKNDVGFLPFEINLSTKYPQSRRSL